ncbi:16S rRNA (uracil(1498)-N(3))-methyltransferase [Brucepastera parasyntrophica]|uniref:16S rRNA (uracil(1498)-N(3))-methyltransferase n=1 Tax=Brucepastera parasyntrophica TaxID=2880008 RepID=UPI00210E87C7|nr:16S rRNA (uracil(1498)-N(3))-methyltransferase [Brucepastera parasyntrophica]ULQ58837.1 16S rRNA (uracil(1498)-N(3))-methyltransferase [Brucepastera parasyntrophica]
MNIILFEDIPFFPRNDERYQHIKKILKKNAGDSFFAGKVNGDSGTARITEFDEKGLTFEFISEQPCRPLYPVILVIGIPRPIQLKRLLRDVSSLGVSAVYLTGTELGEKSYRESHLFNTDAVRTTLIEGAMQSGFTALPECEVFPSVAGVTGGIAERFAEAVPVLLDTVSPVCTLNDFKLPSLSEAKPLILAVGSERGWTGAERNLFYSAGYTVCSMGPRILRTETAAVAGLAVILAKIWS